MTDLTVVILTKNEEKNLRKCVESFRGVAKRFVIVDSFSTDSTEALCKELNAELQKIGSRLDFYQNKWVSYAEQLNWVFRTRTSTQNGPCVWMLTKKSWKISLRRLMKNSRRSRHQ